MNASSVLKLTAFSAPVLAAIHALDADPAKVLDAINAELREMAVVVKSDNTVTASAKTRKDGMVTVNGKQTGKFLIKSSHLVTIVQIETWIEKAPPFVGLTVEFPRSVTEYLCSHRFSATAVEPVAATIS